MDLHEDLNIILIRMKMVAQMFSVLSIIFYILTFQSSELDVNVIFNFFAHYFPFYFHNRFLRKTAAISFTALHTVLNDL